MPRGAGEDVMTPRPCTIDAPVTTLIAYWLGELEAIEESRVEEHLFGCGNCHARLAQIAKLGSGVKRAIRAANMNTVLTPAFVTRLQEAGMCVREYRLQ